jgi:hypothetical protein
MNGDRFLKSKKPMIADRKILQGRKRGDLFYPASFSVFVI